MITEIFLRPPLDDPSAAGFPNPRGFEVEIVPTLESSISIHKANGFGMIWASLILKAAVPLIKWLNVLFRCGLYPQSWVP